MTDPAPEAARPLSPQDQSAVTAYVVAIADDEMLMGHRDSEWTGLGPILEEDIAFSSMAQDELGHALALYRLVEALGGPDPDSMAFGRDAELWRHARLVELPRGDYATSLVRQYLYDLAEAVRYDALSAGSWAPLVEVAVKLRQEEKYHLIHGRTYIERLARATAESRQRIQEALDVLLPFALGLWEAPEGEDALVAAGIVTPSATLRDRWLTALVPFLTDAGLQVAVDRADGEWQPRCRAVLGGRAGHHGPDLAPLLAAMQSLYRSELGAEW